MAPPPSASVFRTLATATSYSFLWTLVGAFLAAGPAAAGESLNLRSSVHQHQQEGQLVESQLGTQLLDVKAGPPSQSESMSYILQTLEKFKRSAAGNREDVVEHQRLQEQRLQAAIGRAHDERVRAALAQSIASSRQSLLETEHSYENIINFSSSMGSLLRSAFGSGHGCEGASCGAHATCTITTGGAKCVCDEGYVGQGYDCQAPLEFRPHHLLLGGGAGGGAVKVTDLHVSVFEANKIAVTFRDVTKGNSGHLVVGKVREAGLVDMSPPEMFTPPSGRAFDPVVIGTDDKRLLVAWRDENWMATCWMRGATLGGAAADGADLAISWGNPVSFCSGQAHKMAVLPFANNRVVVLFSDKVKPTQFTPLESFGNSLLAYVGEDGAVSLLGRFRFSDRAVCRLEATKVTPNGFVLAARGAPAVDDMDGAITTRQEAMALYGEVLGNDVAFSAKAFNVEPEKVQIWSRGVSLIAPHTFAYAYQHGGGAGDGGGDPGIFLAVAEIDPASHHISLTQPPVPLQSGVSRYVSMLSVPYTAADPHTLTYYESNNSSKVSLCSWDVQSKQLSQCEEMTWLPEKLTSVSGIHLGGGKSFMVFTPESGVPYYGVFGLSKKSVKA